MYLFMCVHAGVCMCVCVRGGSKGVFGYRFCCGCF